MDGEMQLIEIHIITNVSSCNKDKKDTYPVFVSCSVLNELPASSSSTLRVHLQVHGLSLKNISCTAQITIVNNCLGIQFPLGDDVVLGVLL